jgi:PAS domain S-box-containing protein
MSSKHDDRQQLSEGDDGTMHREEKKEMLDRDRILSLSQDLICVAGLDGYLKYVNPACQRVLGYSEDEMLARPFMHLVHPDDRDKLARELESLAAGHSTYEFELRHTTKYKTIRHVSWAATPFAEEDVLYCIGRDVTERKQVEKKLTESETRFRAVMEQSPLAIELLAPDGRITKVNSAWKRMWGISEDEAARVLQRYNMLTDPQAEELGIGPLIRKAFAGEAVILPAVEYSADRTADDLGLEGIRGKTPWVQSHLFPVKNDNQEVQFVVNTYVDITDLKRAEQEMIESRDALARANRAESMGQLTGAIAHELNQPLTGILSNAQAAELMLESGRWETTELEEILAEIIADTKRGGKVIQNLREMYRKQQVEFTTVDINAVVDETTRLIRSEFVLRNVRVTTDCASRIPIVNGNRIQLQQVLVNLIMNGIQAMDAVDREARRLHIATAHETNEIKVWVEDWGPGIDSEKIDFIFEPHATWKPGGTGMGLAISDSIIASHGGRMWAENKPEGGFRVGFVVPVPKEGRQS